MNTKAAKLYLNPQYTTKTLLLGYYMKLKFIFSHVKSYRKMMQAKLQKLTIFAF